MVRLMVKKIPYTERIELNSLHVEEAKFEFQSPTANNLLEMILDPLEDYIIEGNPIDVACDLVGVSLATYSTWIKRGEVYESMVLTGEEVPADERYYSFMLRMRKARAVWLRRRVVLLGQDRTPYWQRDLALLERRDRLNWGKTLNEVRPEEYNPDDTFL